MSDKVAEMKAKADRLADQAKELAEKQPGGERVTNNLTSVANMIDEQDE